MTWRNLAHEEGEEKKPMFDHPERQGAKELKEAGYVEQSEFESFVKEHLTKGDLACYCCATCEYAQMDFNAMFILVCTKLNSAEDSIHGCCDHYEYEEGKVAELRGVAKKT